MKLLLLSALVGLSWGCSQRRGWKPQTLEELVSQYELVLLGKDINHMMTTGPSKRKFEIFCVLKGDNKDVPRSMTLMDNYESVCLQITTQVGQSYIMGVSRVNETSFVWSKPHASLAGVHFNYTTENMNKLCGLTKFQTPKPSGSSNMKCPQITDRQMAACPAGLPQSMGLLVTTVFVFLTHLYVSK